MKQPPRGRDIERDIKVAQERDQTPEEESFVADAIVALAQRLRAHNKCAHRDAYLKIEGPPEVGKKYPFFCPSCLRTL